MGIPYEQTAPVVAGEMIYVPAKRVELEDGSVEPVSPFLVGRYPVTVAQMEAFCEATAYRTTAERVGDHDTFRTYPAQMGLPKRAWRGAEAHFVSHLDAEAYCQWSGDRLPSEREWVAAAVVDERTYDRRDPLDSNIPASVQWQHSGSTLEGGFYEWTATVVAHTRAVIRVGPRLLRAVDWRKSKPRMLRDLDFTDVVTGFRICRSTSDVRTGTEDADAVWSKCQSALEKSSHS